MAKHSDTSICEGCGRAVTSKISNFPFSEALCRECWDARPTDLRTIYGDYAEFCKQIGWNPPTFEEWQKTRTMVDAGWRLNHIG